MVIDTNYNNPTVGSLELFLCSCSVLMSYAMEEGLPLRGAVGAGSFFKEDNLLVSTGLIDAASYEKQQNWLGAVLTPKATCLIEAIIKEDNKNIWMSAMEFFTKRCCKFIRNGTVPWKRNAYDLKENFYYIKPFDFSNINWAKDYLPKHYNDGCKIFNSNCLYGEE